MLTVALLFTLSAGIILIALCGVLTNALRRDRDLSLNLKVPFHHVVLETKGDERATRLANG